MTESKEQPIEAPRRTWRTYFLRSLPALVILCGVLVIVAPNLGNLVDHYLTVFGYGGERTLARSIAPLFTEEVDYWADDIRRWSYAYGVDPNLIATIIQIESCGHPEISSQAGAIGLMQVMPQHFGDDEDPRDVEVNAQRGIQIFKECLESPYNPDRDAGLAFACYNGGPSVFVTEWAGWPLESRYYYTWGTGILADADRYLMTSETLNEWLAAGGATLCSGARQSLGLTQTPQ